MIEQSAKVISSDDSTVWLQAERQSTCSGCQLKQGCGTGLLAKHVGKKFSSIAVSKTHQVVVGEQVKLSIPEDALLQGAFLMYIFPLILMFVFAATAHWLTLNEIMEIFAGISGLLIGFILVRIRLKHSDDGFKAKIVEE
jgi:sigma-E factor negative regulatory protein RseC